jgi:hypothetical protein
MEGLAALVVWFKANELLVVSIGFVLSEIIGALGPVKSNGFLSFAIIKVQDYLKKRGAIDLTPND